MKKELSDLLDFSAICIQNRAKNTYGPFIIRTALSLGKFKCQKVVFHPASSENRAVVHRTLERLSCTEFNLQRKVETDGTLTWDSGKVPEHIRFKVNKMDLAAVHNLVSLMEKYEIQNVKRLAILLVFCIFKSELTISKISDTLSSLIDVKIDIRLIRTLSHRHGTTVMDKTPLLIKVGRDSYSLSEKGTKFIQDLTTYVLCPSPKLL